MSDANLSWLMQWYVAECNDDWEHSYGVKIDTLDNPGWTLKIDLRETDLQGRPFERVVQGEPAGSLDEWRSLGSWLVADVKDDVFHVACGPLDLPAAIQVFRESFSITAFAPVSLSGKSILHAFDEEGEQAMGKTIAAAKSCRRPMTVEPASM